MSGISPTAAADRYLTTLAILKVNSERGRGHLDNYLPFLYHCFVTAKPDAVSVGELQDQLKTEFDMEIPQGVLDRLLQRAAEKNKLRLADGVYEVDYSELNDCSLSEEEARIERGHRQLTDALRQFAREEFQLEWAEARANEMLMAYVDGFSSRVLSAAVAGATLPSPDELSPDDFIVHRFASHINDRNADLFDQLVTAVKGRMLADALYYLPDSNNLMPSLKEVQIYFDGPLLLYLMGYAGPDFQAPYLELIEMLDRQDALLRCFEHSVNEAQEILDAAARKARTGATQSHFHGDVVGHLLQTGKSRAEIELLAEKLPRDLLRMKIQPTEAPAHEARYQPDEERLAEILQDRINYGNSVARDRDLDSLTAIYRIRRGRRYRNLADAKAVFIAHNHGLFSTSARFFNTHGRMIPLCIYDSAFTTLVWLQEPQQAPQLPRERVLASAYAALNPSDNLWERFNAAIEQLRAEGEIDDDDAHFLRFADESREALMDYTRGQPDALTHGSAKEILERSRESARAEMKAELDAERQAHSQTQSRVASSRKRAEAVSRGLGASLANFAFLAIGLLLCIGTIFGPVGPLPRVVPGIVQGVCVAIAISIGLLETLADFSLLRLRADVRDRATQTFERVIVRLFQL
jgi:hypothetical protein